MSSILLLEGGIESFGVFLISLLTEAVGPQLALEMVAIELALFARGMWASRSIRQLK